MLPVLLGAGSRPSRPEARSRTFRPWSQRSTLNGDEAIPPESSTASLGEVTGVPSAVESLATRLTELGWVSDLLVAGSLATGDHVAGLSDFDLVAVTEGAVDRAREAALVSVHRDLDRELPVGVDFGCVYVEEGRLSDSGARHPTWTHGALVCRVLSEITRAELVRHGFAVYGRAPSSLLPAMTDDQVRAAARAELCGYWAWASRRPWMWLDPMIADLGLTSMARARYTLHAGQLLTKSASIEQVHAPEWLIDQLRARRRGEQVVSPRLRTAWIAWRDARSTVMRTCHGSPSAG